MIPAGSTRISLLLAGLAIAFLLAPLVIGPFWLFVGIEVFVYALYAASFNLLFGFGGMLPFGHAAFFGLGAYALAILLKKAGLHALLALAAAPLICAMGAGLVAFFCVRLTGIYLGMLSFSFQMLLYTVIFKWYDLTGGDDGLSGISMPGFMGQPMALYYLALVLVVVSLWPLWRLVNSPFGKALQAVKNNPQKCLAIGIDTSLHRWIAFVVAGFFTGLAGALFALANQSVFPGWLNWSASAVPIIMAVLGGAHSFAGPLVGAAIFVLLQTWLTGHTEYWALFLGVLIIGIVTVMPNGILGYLKQDRHE